MTAKLLPRFKQSVARLFLVPSRGGCFEVIVGGKKIYSKLETGEFPDEARLLDAIDAAIG